MSEGNVVEILPQLARYSSSDQNEVDHSNEPWSPARKICVIVALNITLWTIVITMFRICLGE